ncbi:hypothetical protein [Pedobacter sp. MR22-3]|uniref:hypothetical protein n=1 Tax=Pedobacter sp. MR22-3 TaxID=2994552 RepID=UPI0022478F63|nr:hypothetical protein [Pedobacter sp. MR22-3]MCX2584533.1 hypothetical protein [Pedobacter sp. MR22-3]
MKTQGINVEVFTSSLLNRVNSQILRWDFQPVVGEGFYNKPRSKAFIALKMYMAISDESGRSKIIWNASDAEIIKYHENYKRDVETALIFFLKYISALRGESIVLTFEINDATFDFSSSCFSPFEKATIYAIINCFDGMQPPVYRKEIITTLKNNLKHLRII